MSGTVEMYRLAEDGPGARFSCSVPAWNLLWEFGQAFGWRPKGTIYAAPPQRRVEMPPQRRNYQPGDALDRKRVEADDALAWAEALDVACGSPYFAAMVAAQSVTGAGMPAELLLAVLHEFVEFARDGEFAFAISADETAAAPLGGQ